VFDERRFRAQLVLAGVTMKDLAERLGINASTLHRKISNDGAFSRAEINKMVEILHIDDPTDIFFTDKLAVTQDTR
jgi:transcriptional regulator with XRE-family HTH domain